MRKRIVWITLLCLGLSGCATDKPRPYVAKEGWSPDKKGLSNIRLTEFQVHDAKYASSLAARQSLEVLAAMANVALAMQGRPTMPTVESREESPYAAMIYDVTDDVQYLGNIANDRSWHGWLEHQAPPGKRVLMMMSNKHEHFGAQAEAIEFIEIDVVEGKNAYVGVSRRVPDKRTQFVELKIRPDEEAFCSAIKAARDERQRMISAKWIRLA